MAADQRVGPVLVPQAAFPWPFHAREVGALEYGPWDGRPDLRENFFAGYGRSLTPAEDQMLFCYAILAVVSGLH